MPYNSDRSTSRRGYLTAAGTCLVTTALSGCIGQGDSGSSGDDTPAGNGEDDPRVQHSVSEFFDWEHYFTDVDDFAGGIGLSYEVAATNVAQQEYGFATRLKVFQDEEGEEVRVLNQAVQSDSVAPDFTWEDGIGVAVASLDAVTRYLIELYVSEPGPPSSAETITTKTVEFTGEEFRNRIR